jgi:hypothetical protein
MRRTAALALLFVLAPTAATAADSAPQLVLQLGAVGQASADLNHVSMAIDGIYAAEPYGGGWLEFGVLGRTDTINFGPFLPAGPRNTQILEVSTGIVAGPATSQSLYPYFRAGFGFYSDEDVAYYPLLAQAVKSSSVRVNGVEVDTRWEPGASVGAGMRFGPSGIPAAVVEARVHITRFDGDAMHQLLVVSGGFWFR